MPMYYFALKDNHGIHVDPDGTELQNETHAAEHARQVALELMATREIRTRSWRLQVCDSNRNLVFELLFASVDRTLYRLPPALRETVTAVSVRTAALSDAIFDVRMTLHQIKGTLAKSKGVPYLASVNGSRVHL